MAQVVLLRGANLGSRRFSPKAVEKTLSDLGVVNVGAAGTFVVRGKVAKDALLARLADAVPFDPRAILVSSKEFLEAITAGDAIPVPDGAKRFATALASPATHTLPIEEPAGKAWGVRVLATTKRFALGVRRRVDETGVYPNEVVEKAFGVAATTRDWPTMERVARLLQE